MSNKFFCPVCEHTLVKNYYGLICKNYKCPLYFKLEIGWVKMTSDSNWSRKRQMINSFYSKNTRMILMREWALKKREILIRDDYTCQSCGYSGERFNKSKNLIVHHIVYASEEMALYFDNDNLIVLCEECHNKVHCLDKSKFGKGRGDKYE